MHLVTLTVKMETKHPVEGKFGSVFSAICNHCGVMTAWSRKTWKFLRFSETWHPDSKIFKVLFRSFHHLINRRCCVQMS